MKEKLLIQLVEKYRMLYDKTDKEFKDTVKKDIIWRHIANQLNMNGKYARQYYKSYNKLCYRGTRRLYIYRC